MPKASNNLIFLRSIAFSFALLFGLAGCLRVEQPTDMKKVWLKRDTPISQFDSDFGNCALDVDPDELKQAVKAAHIQTSGVGLIARSAARGIAEGRVSSKARAAFAYQCLRNYGYYQVDLLSRELERIKSMPDLSQVVEINRIVDLYAPELESSTSVKPENNSSNLY